MLQGSRVHTATVLDRSEVAPGIVLLNLKAPALAASVRPGQYVMAIPPQGGACAVALAVYEAQGEHASLLFFVVGKRTHAISRLNANETLDLLGPLGNGFTIGSQRDVALVAGGVGIASVLLAAIALRERNARVRLFYGARNAERLVERHRFSELGCEVVAATEDGSDGVRGLVTEALAAAEEPEEIMACGPTPMLRATAALALQRGIRAQLCLEETFGCGVGGCWGCVVPLSCDSAQAIEFPPTPKGIVHARVCREGPVFYAEDLRW
jgi:dihydroorotate dehydrogenase electron transfer subunit